MSLESSYYVSQIVASIAVIASLVYLAVQTRQSAHSQLAQMHLGRTMLMHETMLKMLDPDLGPLVTAGHRVAPEMRDDEIMRYYLFAVATTRNFEELFREWQEGMLADDRWMTTRNVLRGVLRAPGYRAILRVLRDGLDPAFVAVTDTLIEEVRGRPRVDPVAEWRSAAARELAETNVRSDATGD